MSSVLPILAFSLGTLSTGGWIDIACLIFVVAYTALDAYRGFSSTLSVLLGLLVAIHAGYWLYPPVKALLAGTAFCEHHPTAGALAPYVAAVLVGVVLFLLFRYFFRRFFKLIVESPIDQILGAIAGAVKALLVILIIFSGISLLPKENPVRKTFHEKSRTGRCVIPVVQTVLSSGLTALPLPAHHR